MFPNAWTEKKFAYTLRRMLDRDSANFLKLKLSEAVKNNPHYSLRSFATKLGLSPGTLSKLLNRQSKLSISRAQEIAQILRLNEKDKEEFLLLVQIESAKTQGVKSELYQRLRELQPLEAVSLSLEQFQLISEWYGLAIFEMITIFAGQWSSKKIASYLSISKYDVETTMDRLLRLEMIEPDPKGGYRRVKDRVLVSAQIPNEALRNYCRGVMNKAEESISSQSPSEKVMGTEVFAFDPAQLEDARKLTDEYLNKMQKLAKRGTKRTEMYQVFSNFFRLNPEPTTKTDRNTKK